MKTDEEGKHEEVEEMDRRRNGSNPVELRGRVWQK